MSTYKNLIGKDVNFLSTDPDNEQAEGQIWYNSTSNVFKDLLVSEAWSASGGLGSGRYALGQGTGGTVDAGIAVFGRKAGPAQNSTEEYNGSGWSTGGDGNTARYACAKFGTQTAAVAAGGKVTVPSVQNVEEYNGTSWSEETDYPSQARQYLSGFGTLTAGVICGGHNSGTFYGLTDEYDGTNWTTGGAMNNVRSTAGTTGILTAGLTFGGQTPSITAKTEEYNGTAWTESGDMSTARSHLAGSGTQDAALAYGGFTPSSTTQTEAYNGSTWSTSPATLATAVARNSSVGSGASTGLSFGGNPPGTSATEEYNRSVNVITGAAWSSGGAMTTARSGLASAGTQTANVFIGGQMSNSPYAPLNTVELYNGTTWSNNPNNAPYSASNNCGTGTQTAALSWGGYPNVSTTLEFDGSSFSTGGSLSTGRELTSNNIGVQTAAVAAGGYQRSPDVYPTQSEEYNGTAWTAGGAINTPRYGSAGAGTETAGVISGGIEPGQLSATEEYNGSSWTTVNARPYSAGNAGTSGTQTDSLVYGGNPGGALTTTLGYDGTNWSTRPSMSTARAMMGSSAGGTSTAALASSGTSSTATEEFTGETSALNIKTITTS